MSLTKLYGDKSIGISIDLSTYLTKVGLAIADRTALIFMLKSDPTALDADAEYSISEGSALVVSGNKATAFVTDYTDIVVGVPYYMAFGIKFSGDVTYREMPLVHLKRDVKFRQDVSRA